eukprot:scaffold351_cov148-Amphora_coffeaeformis.AAC.12
MLMLTLCMLTYTSRALRTASFLASRRCVGRSAAALSNLSPTAASVTERMQHEAEQNFAKLCQHYGEQQHTTEIPQLLASPSDMTNYLDKHDIQSILFDCDGVLYRSPDPAPGAAACLRALRQSGRRLFFVTNNSAANPAQLRTKLIHILGLDDSDDDDDDDDTVLLTQDMMISTAFTAAQYLKQQLLDDSTTTTRNNKSRRRVYVIGSDGLREEIRQTGFEVVLDGEESSSNKLSMSREELAAYGFDALGIVDAVVVGHDTDFGFRKLCIANVLLQRNPQALLVATNLDAFDLVGGDSRHLPGNGSLVKALEYSSGRQAVDCGKPSRLLADLLDTIYGLDCSKAMFVGDRLDTDIRFAVNTGMHAALVLTGVTTVPKLQSLGPGTLEEPLPTLIVPHVGYLAG